MLKEPFNPIKVLVVDRHTLTRIGLRYLLESRPEIKTIGEAASGAEALRLAAALSPDVVLMDACMPVMNGIETARRLRDQNPKIKILMLTSNDNEPEFFGSFAAGASGYCMKDTDPERLYVAIATVNAGDVWINSSVAKKALGRYCNLAPKLQENPNAGFFAVRKVHKECGNLELLRVSSEKVHGLSVPFSSREKEVITLIVEGLSNHNISERLKISHSTAKTHVSNILNKLSVADRTQAAVQAVRRGLVSL